MEVLTKKCKIKVFGFNQEQMQEGIKYWLYALAHSNIINGLSQTTEIVPVTPWWQMALYVADGILAALTALFVFLGLKSKKKVKE